MSDDAATPTGDADRNVWPAPAPASDDESVTQVPLDKAFGDGDDTHAADAVEDTPPTPPTGPGHTVVAPAPPPQDSVPPAWATPGTTPPPAAPVGPYPPQTSTTAAPAPTPNPFAPPTTPQPHQPAPLSPSPFAPAPFAPAPLHQSGPVPPPPISPDGPGQFPYGYPGQPQAPYGWPVPPSKSNGLGVASMVLGIVSAVGFCLWPLSIILGILAIVLGASARRRAARGESDNPGQALAGIICGTAGLLIGIGLLVLLILLPS